MVKIIRKILFALILVLHLGLVTEPTFAQAGSANDLIAEVNALRQSLGLEPYTIDSELMSFAQTHSQYMASIGYWTHTRADGSTPTQFGIQENVAMGTNMTTAYCVYSIWSDYIHWKTMTEYTSGSVGAGVAFNGDTVFYTLDVRPSSSAVTVADTTNINEVEDAQPQAYINAVITSTPNADGTVIHYVKYGESLWSIAIAYGTTGAEIMVNSGNHPTVTDVYEGQRLIIFTGYEVTPTVPPTQTSVLPTPTHTQPRPTRTPLPELSPTPTVTPEKVPMLYRAFGDSKMLAIGLISVSGVGLLLVLIFGFLKKPKE